MPLSDFGSHDPEFSAQQVAQCARIVDGLREIGTKVVRLGGSVEELAAAADRIEALSAALDAVNGFVERYVGRPGLFLHYFSKERVGSWRARQSWVEPDLRPLDC